MRTEHGPLAPGWRLLIDGRASGPSPAEGALA